MSNGETAVAKPMSKSETMLALATATGLTKQEIETFFQALNSMIVKNLAVDGPGQFSIPGLVKIKVVRKPATPERTGTNPFTKQPTVFKAKPARNVVKVQPLKPLKEMA